MLQSRVLLVPIPCATITTVLALALRSTGCSVKSAALDSAGAGWGCFLCTALHCTALLYSKCRDSRLVRLALGLVDWWKETE